MGEGDWVSVSGYVQAVEGREELWGLGTQLPCSVHSHSHELRILPP